MEVKTVVAYTSIERPVLNEMYDPCIKANEIFMSKTIGRSVGKGSQKEEETHC